MDLGRTVAQAVSRRPLTAEAPVRRQACIHVGFVADKVAVGEMPALQYEAARTAAGPNSSANVESEAIIML
jgi:hypothetical protein